MLAVWLVAGHVAPVLHVATHAAGHTHGPVPRRTAADIASATTLHRSLDEAARRFLDRDDTGPSTETGLRHRADRARGRSDGHAPDAPVPEPDHGAGSAAHFALALVTAPPPFVLPVPAGRQYTDEAPRVVRLDCAPPSLRPSRAPPA